MARKSTRRSRNLSPDAARCLRYPDFSLSPHLPTRRHVGRLAWDMCEDRCVATHAGLGFDESGLLVDGQSGRTHQPVCSSRIWAN